MCLRALAHRLRFVFGRTLCVDVTDYATEALILARAHQYDVLIVDVVMPGGMGVKFIEQVARAIGHADHPHGESIRGTLGSNRCGGSD